MWRRAGSAAIASGSATLLALSLFPDVRVVQTAAGQRKHECSAQGKFIPNCGHFKIFSGSAHTELAQNVARNIGTSLESASISKFNDGEVSIKIDTSVRGADVYVVQPTAPPVSDNLVELLLMISALRNASSRHVTAVVPYFGYMRSDGSELLSRRKGKKVNMQYDDEQAIETLDTHRTSFVSMADIAKMFEIVGCSRIVTFDLHASGQSVAEGFFANTRVENIRSGPVVAKELAQKLNLSSDKELVVVAPHSSCFSKAKKFQSNLKQILGNDNVGLALVVRRPPSTQSGETVVDLVGDVKGKTILIVEDIVDTGRSVARAARAAREAGATNIYAFASHPLLNGDAPRRLQNCEPLEKIVVLNTVPVSNENRETCPKLDLIDVSPMIAKVLIDLHMKDESSQPSS